MADMPNEQPDPNRQPLNDLRRRLMTPPAEPKPAPVEEEPDPRQSLPASLLRKLAVKPAPEPAPEPTRPAVRRIGTTTPTGFGAPAATPAASDSGVVPLGVSRQSLEREGLVRPEPVSSTSKRYAQSQPPGEEVERLTRENADLRGLLEEMRNLLGEASQQEQQFVAQQHAYESAVQERDAQIAQLQLDFAEIEQQIASGELAPPPAKAKSRTELEEWGDELEQESFKLAQERRGLESDRQQLREDERSLEKQMRDMEVQMARERALLARQETELRRLNEEIQRELEMMQRGDAGLREQLAKFQRRHQEVMNRGGQAPAAQAPPAPPQPGPSQQTPPPNKDSGLVRRLFGGQNGNK